LARVAHNDALTWKKNSGNTGLRYILKRLFYIFERIRAGQVKYENTVKSKTIKISCFKMHDFLNLYLKLLISVVVIMTVVVIE